jgi:hypothetical protein
MVKITPAAIEEPAEAPGLHDVVLEDRAAAEHAQHRHRHHRRGDRGGDGQAREQSQVVIVLGRRGSSPGQREGDPRKLSSERWTGHSFVGPVSVWTGGVALALGDTLSVTYMVRMFMNAWMHVPPIPCRT